MNARHAVLSAAIALLVLAPAAVAGPLAQLSIDHVRVRGGEHVLVLRALDGEGRPAEGLEGGLSLQLDGRDVRQPEIVSPFSNRPPVSVTVVLDGDLLQSSSPSSEVVDALFNALVSGLEARDRVSVLSAGRGVRRGEWAAADLRGGAAPVRALAQSAAPRLLDAIDEGLRSAAAHEVRPARVMLVVTRGRDRDSRRRIAELNVDALRRGGLTAVNVLVLGTNADADVVRQLERLATVTGARLRRDGPSALATAADALTLVHRYEVRFPTPRAQGGDDHHRVSVRWEQDGRVLEAAFPYTDDMVAEPAWWTSPAVWFVLLAGIGLLLAILWFLQPRQKALLVVQGGEEDGHWFEVFDLPMRLGAREDNDILVSGPTISGVHCLLEREGRGMVLVDQGAAFGTFVNGERVTRRVLEDDDVIRLGQDVELVFEARG
jgi:hypothetical protein